MSDTQSPAEDLLATRVAERAQDSIRTEPDDVGVLQGAPLLLRSDGGKWVVPPTTTWADEASLQEIVAANPTILPGVTDPATAAVTEFHIYGVGRLDVLCVEPSGALTLCEAKLQRNPEIRRWVTGQVLAYASGLEQMTFDEVDQAWAGRCGRSLAASVLGDDAEPNDVHAFEASVRQRLANGHFRLVLAVDELTPELRRTITYLARHTTETFELVALELAYARRDGVEILVPRSWGTESAITGRSPGATKAAKRDLRVPLDEVALIVDPCELAHPGAGRIITDMLDRLAPRLAYLWFGDAERPEVGCVVIADEPIHCQPMAIRPGHKNPGIHLCFGWMSGLGEERLERLLTRLEANPALAKALSGVREANYKKRPLIPFTLLDDPTTLDLLVSALDEALTPMASPT